MTCGTSAVARRWFAATTLWGCAFLVDALTLSLPATAGDTPSLQDFLGRAQTQTERKAVEDLVDKLGGHVHALAFLIELVALNGRERLAGQHLHTVLKY